MPKTVTDEKQLEALTRFLDQHCRENNIVPNSTERQALATRLTALWRSGLHSLDALKRLLG